MSNRRRPRSFWEKLASEVDRVGSVERVARRHGIEARSLTWWRWRLRRDLREKAKATTKASGPRLLPVVVAALERRVLGPKSERRRVKMPPPVPRRGTTAAAAERREGNRALLEARLEREIVPVTVPREQRCCPRCPDLVVYRRSKLEKRNRQFGEPEPTSQLPLCR